jgi:two-component system, NtrC family, C4-dicarboxylate transport response regulator DctD
VILGETGTGKEVVARCIHDFSSRSEGPFVAVNCAALPSELIESELFGHEAGAFTGSSGRRIGKFEFANRGTLLLDEIESMPLSAQAKMLRVIQERTVERVGSNKSIPLDLRIIAATKVDLLQEAEAGRFRSDLYFRLNMASISLPPLRDREDDSIVLFHHFMELAERRFRRSVSPLHSWNIEALMAHTWPGNVRELKATADKFVLGIRGQGDALSHVAGLGTSEAPVASLPERIARYERRIIEEELKRANNSISSVSKTLGVPRRTMAAKITRLGLGKSR